MTDQYRVSITYTGTVEIPPIVRKLAMKYGATVPPYATATLLHPREFHFFAGNLLEDAAVALKGGCDGLESVTAALEVEPPKPPSIIPFSLPKPSAVVWPA